MKKRVNPMKHPFRIGLLAVVLLMAQMTFASAENSGDPIAAPTVTQQGKVTEVTGTVSDSSGPVIGASVVIKGTSTGVITNLDGNFTLRVPDGAILVISYIGYLNKEVPYKGERVLNISLDENVQALDEVQIIAYGTTRKVTVTGAMSSMNSKEILKAPVGNIGNALAGKVTGFSSVQQSGQPGADDPKVYVRGVGSLSTDLSAPLMLVDGVERSFYRLDPNEIEDITILKDASATAVFGVRGANGVILVTTKRGQEGPAQITFSTSAALQLPTQLPEVAGSYDHAMAYNAAQLRDDPNSKLAFTPAMLEGFKNGLNPLMYPDTDWLDYLTNKVAFQSQHNLNISGGSKNVRYFASLGVFTQEGLFKSLEKDYNSNYNYNRYNYRVNMDIDVTKTTSFKINLGGRLDDRRTPVFNNGSVKDLKYVFRDIYSAVPFSGAGLVNGKRVLVDSSIYSHLGTIYDGMNVVYGKGYNDYNNNTLNFDFTFDQKLDVITKGLRMHVKGAYNSGMDMTKRREGRAPAYQAINSTNGIYLKRTQEESLLAYEEVFGRERDWYLEGAINYRRDFGLHHVSAMAMYNQSMKYYPEGSWKGIPRSYVGFVGRATYDYNTKYLFDFSIGYNGSENFAPGKRFGTFPAASVGWIISEEKFMESLKPYLNYLKLRASYGLVGNDRVSDKSRFLYLPDSYSLNAGDRYRYNFGTENSAKLISAVESKKGNPDVSWEKASKQNYGVDIHFLDSRLKTTFDYFVEHRIDILSSRNNPGYLAVTLPTANIGKVDNKGFEVSVRWEDQLREFSYYIDVNMSYAKNKIVYTDEVKYPNEYTQRTGRPVGQNFGLKANGFFSKEEADLYNAESAMIKDKNNPMTEQDRTIPNHGSGFAPKPGDVKYFDLNGDNVIDNNDVSYIGYPIYPLLTGGINMGFSYKGFDFSMTWSGAAKTSRMIDGIFRDAFGGKGSDAVMKYLIDEAWTPEKGNSSKYPAITFANKGNNNQNSDLWLRNSSYLRLKNIEVGYSLSNKVLEKTPLSSCRFSLSGYNLFTFDKLDGIIDPEADPSSNIAYPIIRIVNLGVRVSF